MNPETNGSIPLGFKPQFHTPVVQIINSIIFLSKEMRGMDKDLFKKENTSIRPVPRIKEIPSESKFIMMSLIMSMLQIYEKREAILYDEKL